MQCELMCFTQGDSAYESKHIRHGGCGAITRTENTNQNLHAHTSGVQVFPFWQLGQVHGALEHRQSLSDQGCGIPGVRLQLNWRNLIISVYVSTWFIHCYHQKMGTVSKTCSLACISPDSYVSVLEIGVFSAPAESLI